MFQHSQTNTITGVALMQSWPRDKIRVRSKEHDGVKHDGVLAHPHKAAQAHRRRSLVGCELNVHHTKQHTTALIPQTQLHPARGCVSLLCKTGRSRRRSHKGNMSAAAVRTTVHKRLLSVGCLKSWTLESTLSDSSTVHPTFVQVPIVGLWPPTMERLQRLFVQSADPLSGQLRQNLAFIYRQ